MTTQSHKPVILLDLDGTLFDAHQLKQHIDKDLQKLNLDTHRLWKLEREHRGNGLHVSKSIQQYAKEMTREDQISAIQDSFLNQPFEHFLYSEVKSTLTQLKKHATLAAFTQGDVTYQQVKINQSGLDKYFEYLYVFDNKIVHLEEVCKFFPNQTIWYIDNQKTLLEDAAKVVPRLKTVWIDRETHPEKTNFDPAHTITSLDQLHKIVFPS